MTPYGTQAIVRQPISGLAAFSLLAALVAVATLTMPTVALGLGFVSLVMALISQRQLRLEPNLRGSRIALAGVLLGGSAVLVSGPGLIVGLLGFAMRAARFQVG